MPELVGQTLGHYRIVERLGAGGMGEVYRARDERLDRQVAIKVLPEDVATDPDRLARFEREAKAVARLSHPNILEIHELGEQQGQPFMVTEVLEGETLRERLDEGALGWRRATEIGAAIANGLAAAHQAGIVHRDLKPSNVFVTSDGRVKVLDFGLAKLEEAPMTELETVTSPPPGTLAGTVLGTVGYMAPEQVRGEPADQRSDIFALGCVLYEMLTGGSPFGRETAAETMTAILREDHPEIAISGVEVTPELNRLLSRCLEKRPRQRFQSAADLAFALRSLGTDAAPLTSGAGREPVPALDPHSIAVLPFANLSPDPDNEYFSDGLTEEIIADLARVRAIKVISRTSSMRFKGVERDLPGVASELGVRFVLEGSVRKAGDNLRITAQLIDASSDTHLWAEKYTGTLDDVFELQEEISRRIVDALEVSLTADEDRRLAARPIPDGRVFDTWLRVKQAGLTFTAEGFERGLTLTQNALDTVGDNALLLATLGWLEIMRYSNIPGSTEDSLAHAETYTERALKKEPDHPWALFVRSIVQQRRGDSQGFARYAQRSLQRERNSHVLSSTAAYLGDVGRTNEARRYADEGMTLDPLAWLSVWACGYLDLLEGRFDQAFVRLREGADRLAPGEPWSAISVGYAAAHVGDKREVEARFATASSSGDQTYSALGALFLAAMRGDERSLNEAMDSPYVRPLAWRNEHHSAMVASWLAHCGLADAALDWLEHAVDLGFSNHRYLGDLSPLLEPFHGNPRFEAVLTIARDMERAFEL